MLFSSLSLSLSLSSILHHFFLTPFLIVYIFCSMHHALVKQFDCAPFIFQIFLPPINGSCIVLFHYHNYLTFHPWATFSISCVKRSLYSFSIAYLCLIPHNTGRGISVSSFSVQSVSMILIFRFIKVQKISLSQKFLNFFKLYICLLYINLSFINNNFTPRITF